METDSVTDDFLLERLSSVGVPKRSCSKPGLVEFVRANRFRISELVSVLLPTEEDVRVVLTGPKGERSGKSAVSPTMKKRFRELMIWLQWLMFEDDPGVALKHLTKLNVDHQRAVCGYVWGENDIGYQCRTCENDSSCAICVPCFDKGNHTSHDYSFIYPSGGCCDCGDHTSWKQEGFCSNHKGSEQIPSLSENLANTVRPVLDALFDSWKKKLLSADSNARSNYSLAVRQKMSNELTFVVVEMLLKFHKSSDSLLILVSRRIIASSGLLSLLVKAERFLDGDVIQKLHEVFLKLIGDPVFKSEFAKALVSYYPIAISEAVKKGTDHAFRKYQLLSTFSMQIFTVPTLTSSLVRETNLLPMLLGCLIDIFQSCCHFGGVLQASKWIRLWETSHSVFRDLKFVTSHAVVSEYATREHGEFSRSWLTLLTFAQGIDPQKRATKKQTEEENEYMHLYFYLSHSIADIHFLLFNGTKVGKLSHEDSACNAMISSSMASGVHEIDGFHARIPSYAIWLIRECLKVLVTCLGNDKCISIFLYGRRSVSSGVATKNTSGVHILGRCDWPDIHYDVRSEAISVHLPLHRLLSLLIAKALRMCYGESALHHGVNISLEIPQADFFSYVLGDFHPCGFSAFVMEHVLRVRVFCAQVIAGMWKKNGDSALESCDWYRSVRRSEQGLELDLFLLQCCGALAPADSYVNTLLRRFGLTSYLQLNPDITDEYEPVLVQEMLALLIQILQERRFCGLSTAESLRREIICKLATGDFTRSQLLKSLPRDLCKLDELQEVLDKVSVYRCDPSGTNQGMYSLQSSCWGELDLHHPRLHSGELKSAEERFFRDRRVSASTTQLPRWRSIYPPLEGLSRIGTCRATFQIISSALYYALQSGTSVKSRAPDDVLIPALHLLSLSLDICTQQRESNTQACCVENAIPILRLAGLKITGQGTGKESLLSLLVSLMRARKDDHLEQFPEAASCKISFLIGNLLKRFSAIDSVFMNLVQSLAPEVFGVTSGSTSYEKQKANARERRAAMLARITADQTKFSSTFSSSLDFDDQRSETSVVCCHCQDSDSEEPVSLLVFLQKSKLLSFVDRGPPSWDQGPKLEKNMSVDGDRDVQRSNVSSDSLTHDAASEPAADSVFEASTEKKSSDGRGKDELDMESLEITVYETCSREVDNITNHNLTRVDQRPHGGESSLETNLVGGLSSSDGFHPTDCDGVFLSSCGHSVHQSCLDSYVKSLSERSNVREDDEPLQEGELVCPACRGLANSVLPACPADLCSVSRKQENKHATLGKADAQMPSFWLSKALCLLRSAADMTENGDSVRTVSLQGDGPRRKDLEWVSRKLWNLYFSDRQEKFPGNPCISQSILMWDTLKYSLISMEIVTRRAKSSMLPVYCIGSLYEELNTSNGTALSILLRVVQSTRTKNDLHVCQRFMGLKHLAESICSGTSSSSSSSIFGSEGSSKNINLLWNRASYPVLSQDPFSSLMWALFCLPFPFITCNESLLSLVHIFYGVSLVQTAIAYCAGRGVDLSETNLEAIFAHVGLSCTEQSESDDQVSSPFGGRNLLSYISDALRESDGWEYFRSNNMDLSCDIKETIRKCSLPFLRRCALLWRLLKASDVPSDVPSDVASESELTHVNELEKLFKIPPIDTILNDELLGSSTQAWLRHFKEEYKVNGVKGLLYITPVVPFQLMKLPNLYQDLVQRWCIKRRCSNCKEAVKEPALCLLCGILCIPCCSESVFRTHADTCGAGTGVFLLIRETKVLLQRFARELSWPSPYVDKHREEDIDMSRGEPLYLNEERYTALTDMVSKYFVSNNDMNQ